METCNVFIFSPVIESGVDITIPIKKKYGVMSAQSNSQKYFLQMIARCRMVEEPVINVLSDRVVAINENHNFWTYKDVYETNRHIIHKPTYSIEYGKLTMSEGVDERRTIVPVFNKVDRLSKHPAVYLNFLKLLVERKGMPFTVDKESLPEDSAYKSSKDHATDYNMELILNAKTQI